MLKRGSTTFLKLVLLIIGLLVLGALFYFPQTEGRAANLNLISIYADPLIIYVYITFIPFFAAMHQAVKLLGLIENDKVFSGNSVRALRNIKYCAIAFALFIAFVAIYIRLVAQGSDDDPAGAMAIGIVTIFASIVIATAAGVFQNLLQRVVDIKSENDLTV